MLNNSDTEAGYQRLQQVAGTACPLPTSAMQWLVSIPKFLSVHLPSEKDTVLNFPHKFAPLPLSRLSCGTFHRSAPAEASSKLSGPRAGVIHASLGSALKACD